MDSMFGPGFDPLLLHYIADYQIVIHLKGDYFTVKMKMNWCTFWCTFFLFFGALLKGHQLFL